MRFFVQLDNIIELGTRLHGNTLSSIRGTRHHKRPPRLPNVEMKRELEKKRIR